MLCHVVFQHLKAYLYESDLHDTSLSMQYNAMPGWVSVRADIEPAVRLWRGLQPAGLLGVGLPLRGVQADAHGRGHQAAGRLSLVGQAHGPGGE